jgi:hypothetical protein
VARLVRYALVMAAAGVGAGMLAAGAGGRLVMRVLALTSPEVHGATTEVGAVIGDVTLGGTLGFVFFVGLLTGLFSGLVGALLLPLLPRGRAGGLALGAALLVLAGSRVEPLRADNFDFVLVGPDWLSVLLFAAVALFQGMLVVALAGRMAGEGAPARPLVAGARRPVIAGRLVAAVAFLAVLPGFATSVADILTSA